MGSIRQQNRRREVATVQLKRNFVVRNASCHKLEKREVADNISQVFISEMEQNSGEYDCNIDDIAIEP